MFKNILIPISSEFYSKEVLERSVLLAEKFKSSINLIYIIEEKMLDFLKHKIELKKIYNLALQQKTDPKNNLE